MIKQVMIINSLPDREVVCFFFLRKIKIHNMKRISSEG